MDILEQVGITKEELIERIVERALGVAADYRQTGCENWQDIPLSEVVDKKITEAIGNLVKKFEEKIETRVDEITNAEVNKLLEKPFQPVNEWGEAKGEKTTVKQIIVNYASGYWDVKIGSDGKPVREGVYHYDNLLTRGEAYAQKVVKDIFTSVVEKQVKEIASDLAAKIPETIGSEISKMVVKHLRR